MQALCGSRPLSSLDYQHARGPSRQQGERKPHSFIYIYLFFFSLLFEFQYPFLITYLMSYSLVSFDFLCLVGLVGLTLCWYHRLAAAASAQLHYFYIFPANFHQPVRQRSLGFSGIFFKAFEKVLDSLLTPSCVGWMTGSLKRLIFLSISDQEASKGRTPLFVACLLAFLC